MEKKRWVLILMGLCLALAFSVSSVEAEDMCMAGGNAFDWPTILPERCDRDGDCYVRNNNRCKSSNDLAEIDCDDNDPLVIGSPPCNVEPPPPPPPPPMGPIIAIVANKFNPGHATGYITSQLFGGIYTNIRVNEFNNQSPGWLRERFDVLHIQWGSPSSMRVSWPKLLAFMNAVPVGCAGAACIGGGILFEDPQNVLELEIDGLVVTGVEHHVAGNDPAVVEFAPSLEASSEMYDEPEEILSAFVDQGFMNDSGYFADGPSETFCLNYNPFSETIQTLGLGYGCLANNHMTFGNVQPLGLIFSNWKVQQSDSTGSLALVEFSSPAPTVLSTLVFPPPPSRPTISACLRTNSSGFHSLTRRRPLRRPRWIIAWRMRKHIV